MNEARIYTAAVIIIGNEVLLRLPERAFAIVFKTVLTVLALRLLWSAFEVFVHGAAGTSP